MRHPLESVPAPYSRRFFFFFLVLTAIIFGILGFLDQHLKPNGILRFEFARTPETAREMVSSWSSEGKLYAALGLGLDYLFMPTYALALAFGMLLVVQKHSGCLHSLGVVAGYGAFVAALFDAVENFALWQVLLGAFESNYPAMAAFCALIKFGLLGFGVLVGVAGLAKKATVTSAVT